MDPRAPLNEGDMLDDLVDYYVHHVTIREVLETTQKPGLSLEKALNEYARVTRENLSCQTAQQIREQWAALVQPEENMGEPHGTL